MGESEPSTSLNLVLSWKLLGSTTTTVLPYAHILARYSNGSEHFLHCEMNKMNKKPSAALERNDDLRNIPLNDNSYKLHSWDTREQYRKNNRLETTQRSLGYAFAWLAESRDRGELSVSVSSRGWQQTADTYNLTRRTSTYKSRCMSDLRSRTRQRRQSVGREEQRCDHNTPRLPVTTMQKHSTF